MRILSPRYTHSAECSCHLAHIYFGDIVRTIGNGAPLRRQEHTWFAAAEHQSDDWASKTAASSLKGRVFYLDAFVKSFKTPANKPWTKHLSNILAVSESTAEGAVMAGFCIMQSRRKSRSRSYVHTRQRKIQQSPGKCTRTSIGKPRIMDCLKVLGEIPADPFGTHRQILSTEVISLRGLSAKKTSELVLAVNSIGINIYDVCALKPSSDCTPSQFSAGSIRTCQCLLRHFTINDLHMSTACDKASRKRERRVEQAHLLRGIES